MCWKSWEVSLDRRSTVLLSEQAIKAAIYDYAVKNNLELEGLKDYDPNAEEDDHHGEHEDEE